MILRVLQALQFHYLDVKLRIVFCMFLAKWNSIVVLDLQHIMEQSRFFSTRLIAAPCDPQMRGAPYPISEVL